MNTIQAAFALFYCVKIHITENLPFGVYSSLALSTLDSVLYIHCIYFYYEFYRNEDENILWSL